MTEHDDRTIGATAPDASIRFSFSLSLSIYIYTGLVVDGRGSFAAYKEIQRRDRSIRGVGLCLLSRPQKNCYKQRKRERTLLWFPSFYPQPKRLHFTATRLIRTVQWSRDFRLFGKEEETVLNSASTCKFRLLVIQRSVIAGCVLFVLVNASPD